MAGDSGAHGDYKAHESSYERFISLFKVGTVASIVVTAIVVLLIAS